MRVNTVNKAQKVAGTCISCHESIDVGQGYYWAAAFRSPRVVRHIECGPFRASQIASNDKLSSLYSAQEAVEDWIEGSQGETFTLDDAQAVMEEAADAVEEVGEQYSEGASSIEDGFGHPTSQSEEMTDHADECSDWASALRDALDSLSEFDDSDDEDEDDTEKTDLTDEEKFDAWRQEVFTAMQDAANECPL